MLRDGTEAKLVDGPGGRRMDHRVSVQDRYARSPDSEVDEESNVTERVKEILCDRGTIRTRQPPIMITTTITSIGNLMRTSRNLWSTNLFCKSRGNGLSWTRDLKEPAVSGEGEPRPDRTPSGT